jgi:hypothetical protein
MADTRIYKVIYNDGSTKLATRKILGAVVGTAKGGAYFKRPVAIGRAPEPEWEDVTSEFLGEK